MTKNTIKNIIAIASGKGGVGKSTTAVNLALALQQTGARVGILDADIHGPNQPTMLGVRTKPEVVNGKLKPVMAHGIQSMSIGYLMDQEDTAMIWRGPIVSKALQQLYFDTLWDDVEYLIIDLPPGTGDVQLTLSQKVPVTAAIIVTTPQDIALQDARKGLKMFNKVNIPVLGVIENMSYYQCPSCNNKDHIFGEDGGKRMATEYKIDLLGQLPLNKTIREQADKGTPIVLSDPNSQSTQEYKSIANKILKT